ncbi:MAG TPA: hypothetical protein VLB67_12250 [Acidimicrobiia bacterium]|nr:hypothetical protein [Acidimicrobiia bacterium]
MSTNDAERVLELEESAEGVDLFRPPGDDLLLEKARDQAEASGWIPEREDPVTSRLGAALQQREPLLSAIQRLEAAAARPGSAPGWADGVGLAVEAVADALGRHIAATEGKGGLLEEVLEGAPRLTAEVAAIEAEHEDLERAIERVRVSLQRPSEVRAIRRRVIRLLGHLVDHRQRGSDLVYEAYSVDLGAGG